MKIVKCILLWGLSLVLFFTFSSISLADTATSQAGIYFTEGEEVKVEDESGTHQKNQVLPNTEGNRMGSNLPQTGEYQDLNLLIIGLILLMISMLVGKLKIKRGGRMMKLKTMTMVGLIGSGMLVGTSLVHAAPQDEVTGSTDGKGGTSHGYINLTAGDTGPKDPLEPTVPPGGTGNEGVLTLDNVAPLLFSTHKLDGKEQVYTSVVENSNIQVTDVRGEETGWHVQVSQTPFKDITDETKVLKGTTLILPAGVVKPDEGNVSLAPTVRSVEVNADVATLMNATSGTGAGTWRTVFDKDEVKLTVAAGNKKGEYMSTVTWTLSDAPK
ncbi:Extracellular domain protein [Carnobacterium maltaromaticum]|uniref:WxL domain-containing protein n=1 Tax=Carnobacterium maltaromaticum TaxID=2751 RepID=A0AAW9JRY4_CARML|nr:WxL domain-containing protein [Carnobacterium maltaromaticum]MDZ5759530.1 WxL domain-containing protein [Carnobacterium maltaromaticum]CAD5897457.1 Extracellular domain protein [Carnobacterium maltaromaticum]